MWPFCSPSLRQAAFVVRRLAWAEGTSCTRYLRGLLHAAAQAAADGRVCAACRQHHGDRDLLGQPACDRCPLQPAIVVVNDCRQHDAAA